ncbi:hypothetical protein FEE96_12450 [Parasedimentitalea maritima]|uniref:Streptomycin resistance protein n=1 Tax=Parasedimentitalea maritima TaxID=2578117 RepID=A0ABY2V0L9_9RHOB|nr:aminoglycoside phosphotransferase family protein [Zongyanglinia marina]TLP64566.1 hypothetical protein FEE96_12450 [Zongyanglinia marina]
MSRNVMTDDLNTVLARWQLTQAEHLSQTAIAQLWRVRRADGTSAVLKLYKNATRGNESAGAKLLTAWSGRAVVEILENDGAAMLMQWLDGPSLGDIARSGDAKQADQLLCETAQSLQQHPISMRAPLRSLGDAFSLLPQLTYCTNCPTPLRKNMLRATAMANHLLATQPSPVPLHGDLHHDNVILTVTGPKAFDAKGYTGDPAFELANALRHPKGLPAHVKDHKRITQTTQLFAQALGVPCHRLAQWAAAKCALSICWRANGLLIQDDEADLLSLLVEQALATEC